MQEPEHFADKQFLAKLVEKMKHPDHDIQERSFLALISVSGRPKARQILLASGALKSTEKARKHCEELMHDADEDYQEIIQNLIVLSTDLEEILRQGVHDRSEL